MPRCCASARSALNLSTLVSLLGRAASWFSGAAGIILLSKVISGRLGSDTGPSILLEVIRGAGGRKGRFLAC